MIFEPGRLEKPGFSHIKFEELRMRWSIWIVLAALTFHGSAEGKTLFEGRAKFKSIQAYKTHLSKFRLKLFSKDEDNREEALERILNSLENPPQKGDSAFPFQMLGDFVVGIGKPEDGEIDKDLQEKGLKHLIENALDDDYSITRREFALLQLDRIIRAKTSRPSPFLEDTLEALEVLSKDSQPVLSLAAIYSLGALAGRKGKAWEDIGEEAAEILVKRMDSDDLEIRRFAILTTIRTLNFAVKPTDTPKELWEELVEAVEDIKSPKFFRGIRPHLTRLIEAKKNSPFSSQVGEAKEALRDFKRKTKPSQGPFNEVLSEFSETDDLWEINAALARIELEGRGDSALRALGLNAVIAKASKPNVTPYTLRVLLASMLLQGRVYGSPSMYYRSSIELLELAMIHRNNGKANIPLTHLAMLLASTDRPGLVIPVLNEIKSFAVARTQPVWTGRRMIALLFLQAGDAPKARIRLHALMVLEEIGKSSKNWALRSEVWTRMSHLARFAKDHNVKSRAAKWLKG